MNKEQFVKNAALSGRLAAEGMVLLENKEDLLPFLPGCRIALFGAGQINMSDGGTGSAKVLTSYVINPLEGLSRAEKDGKIIIDSELKSRYTADLEFVPSAGDIAAAAGRNDAACLFISRNAGEGTDRKDIPGDFRLSEAEENLIEALAASPFKKIAVVVNSGGMIDLSWFGKYENFKSLLFIWQPGMEGGVAVARILCGDFNPSGRLVDTVALSCDDWPSTAEFQLSQRRLNYSEDIYVGYRYFETIPGMKDRVLYPFGYGLSYTTFEITGAALQCDGETVTVRGCVTNTGKRPGREVVQCYVSCPGENRPAIELRAYTKTPEIAPGKSVQIELSFPFNDLWRFDDDGLLASPGSFVIEAGTYTFMLGQSVRNTVVAGTYELLEQRVTGNPGNIFRPLPPSLLQADGSKRATGGMERVLEPENITICKLEPAPVVFDPPIMLKDVADGKASMDDFVSQMSLRDLMELCHGQPSAVPRSTGGIGNLLKFGVPNVQTADGPAGIRWSTPMTSFPCATLIACSWDDDLKTDMGKIMGAEGVGSGLDILLAPGLNIHRNPLCGRNFEYFSEDPLIAGKSAAAIVRGVQSEGMGATLKHFAANSRENQRKRCDSIVSDRALREIYLRGFEIAVRESDPWCIMSSYNLINGVYTAENHQLLSRLLREEWQYEGIVMTDWVTTTTIARELWAGNDVKMPMFIRDEYEAALYANLYNNMPRAIIERSAKRVLNMIMKTRCFQKHSFGKYHTIPASGCKFDGQLIYGVNQGNTFRVRSADNDGGYVHSRLRMAGSRAGAQLLYLLEFEESGNYAIDLRIASPSRTLSAELIVDGKSMDILPLAPTMADNGGDNVGDTWDKWSTQGELKAYISAGKHEVYINFIDPERIGCSFNYFNIRRKG